MPIIFAASADKHGVPRESSRFVALTSFGHSVVTNWGEKGSKFVGEDNRGIELEVITVPRGRNELLVHSMPTSNRYQKGIK